MSIFPRTRITCGNRGRYQFSKGEVSLSLFGHCEEVAVQPGPDDWFHFIVRPVRAFAINRRPVDHLHRIAGRPGRRAVMELVWR